MNSLVIGLLFILRSFLDQCNASQGNEGKTATTTDIYGTAAIDICSSDSQEWVILVESTAAFVQTYPEWQQNIRTLVDLLTARFDGEASVGIASFSDKPIPFSGQGKYGNFQDAPNDYCYEKHLALTTNVSTVPAVLSELAQRMEGGMDSLQGQLEALIFSVFDASLGWNSIQDSRKYVLMVTANEMHRPRDAWSSRNNWSWKRIYSHGYDKPSTGGFGADGFPDLGSIRIANDQDKADYAELASYFHIIDGFAAHAPGFEQNITIEQKQRLMELVEKFGPYPYVELKYPEHPGDNSVADCVLTEYPTMQQAGLALGSASVFPVFLVTPNVYNYYSNELPQLGIDSVVVELAVDASPSDLLDEIISKIGLDCTSASWTEPISNGVSSFGSTKLKEPIAAPLSPDSGSGAVASVGVVGGVGLLAGAGYRYWPRTGDATDLMVDRGDEVFE
eukprot:Gregarina_sp_Poly_1__7260@NODE_399_length_8918_cov_1168_676534_g322_i1_p4_GENE_NODE_399_length_8918_cov_1168_676534_g322_i1NODE_399_length_8918_cov_1168_676534_g322_i1_p4_ORF_typecomplete_len449_score52_17Integrin_beta/PF00362_18/2_7e11Integrin_beta/PF00362_18/0_0032WXG100/PF06013_12/23WXG100/PF06013_12/26_NODE_399_length_8918_cov_1168_676534_g322_i121063452